MKKLSSYKNIFYLFFILTFTCALFGFMLVTKTRRFGDSNEYFLMLEAFTNHHSFNQRDSDVNGILELKKEYGYDDVFYNENYKYFGYFEGVDGKQYSYHFWLYPLLTLPTKLVLRILEFDELRAFQLFNSLMFTGLLIFSYGLYKKNNKTLLAPFLLVFCPLAWFLHAPHTEVFSFVFATLSLQMFFHKQKYWAVLLSAIAASQNTPLNFLTLFYLIFIAYEVLPKKDITDYAKSILKLTIPGFITILPFVFYYKYFHTFNLIADVGGADTRLISAKRVLELFFDPNIGLVTYMPITSFLYFCLLIFCFVKILKGLKKRDVKTAKVSLTIVLLFVVLLAQLALASSTTNWNSGTIGANRYTLWSILPIIFISFVLWFETLSKDVDKLLNKLITLTFIFGILVNSFIVLVAGFWAPNGRFGPAGLTIPSRLVLNYTPSLYNPSFQIFEGRVLCGEKNCDMPIIYRYNDTCKKALIADSEEALKQVSSLCSKSATKNYCENNKCYVSF